MNNRRKFLVALGTFPLAWARAQASERTGKSTRVGILVGSTAAKFHAQEKIFTDALRNSGWIEGNNVIYDRAYADDDELRLPLLAEGLVKRNSNLIFANSNAPAIAAYEKTRTIPIVFNSVSRPVESGLAKSLAHPGGNITGVSNIGHELGGKRMQLLRQAMPKVSRIGVLINSARTDDGFREKILIEQAAVPWRAKIIPAIANRIDEIEAAFAVLSKNRVEALLVAHQALFITGGRKHVLAFSAKYRMPVIGPRAEFADDGGFMSYGANIEDQTRRAGQLADKILRGTKPADIPIEQPTKFDLVVNKISAHALGISIPNEIMLQATRVIE